MSFWKKSLIGLGLLGAGTGLYVYLNQVSKNKKSKQGKEDLSQNMSKEIVIKILKTMKNEFFTVFSTIAMMYNQFKSKAQGKVSEEELAEFMSQNPQINEQIQAIEMQIYEKFNITQPEFKYNCEVAYKNDPEVKALLEEIKNNYEKAKVGSQPDIQTVIPDNLTPSKTIQILQKIMKENMKKMQQIFAQLKKQGVEINLDDPRVVSALNAIKFDEIKSEIFKESGLDKFEDTGANILQYATTVYQRSNSENFNQQLMQLELKQRSSMQEIQKNPENEDIVEKIFNDKQEDNLMELLEENIKAIEQEKQLADKKKKSNEEMKTSAQNVIAEQGNGEGRDSKSEPNEKKQEPEVLGDHKEAAEGQNKEEHKDAAQAEVNREANAEGLGEAAIAEVKKEQEKEQEQEKPEHVVERAAEQKAEEKAEEKAEQKAEPQME